MPSLRRLSRAGSRPGVRPLSLREDERRDLIAFLQSLTDEALLRDPRWSDPWPVSAP